LCIGHASCGAIKGACDNAKLGNLAAKLNKIKPAVNAVSEPKDKNLRNSSNLNFVDTKNVLLTLERIRNESEILSEMVKNGEITIISTM
jgi:carbonic anhydrase